MRKAYELGFLAGFEGRTADCNPFASHDPQFEEWDTGHADGAYDLETENQADEDVEEWDDLPYEGDVDDYYYDDSMDGDHESALDSIGWGCDEAYDHYDGGYED